MGTRGACACPRCSNPELSSMLRAEHEQEEGQPKALVRHALSESQRSLADHVGAMARRVEQEKPANTQSYLVPTTYYDANAYIYYLTTGSTALRCAATCWDAFFFICFFHGHWWPGAKTKPRTHRRRRYGGQGRTQRPASGSGRNTPPTPRRWRRCG